MLVKTRMSIFSLSFDDLLLVTSRKRDRRHLAGERETGLKSGECRDFSKIRICLIGLNTLNWVMFTILRR